jgi:hypothetical protein
MLRRHDGAWAACVNTFGRWYEGRHGGENNTLATRRTGRATRQTHPSFAIAAVVAVALAATVSGFRGAQVFVGLRFSWGSGFREAQAFVIVRKK